MKCFKIYEDRLPSEGIPLGENGRTGLFENCCPVSNDNNIATIPMSVLTLQVSPLSGKRFYSMIFDANFLPRTKTEFAIITAVKPDEVPGSAMIYIVFDRNGNDGDLVSGEFFGGGAKINETNSINIFHDYCELYFYLPPNSKFLLRRRYQSFIIENVDGEIRYYKKTS